MKPISLPVLIHTISYPLTDADIRQHRSIRLDALHTDPKSFLSTYAEESGVDHAKWRERLEQEGVWTFYAKIDEGNKYAPPKPWLATLSLLSPSFLTWFLASSCPTPITTHTVSSPNPSWPLSLLDSGTDLWLIIGLWVRPEWRRRGVAQEIVQKAVHSVITSPSHSRPSGAATPETAPDAYQSLSGSSNSKTTIILLEVYAHNIAAVELYRSVGFEILPNPDQPRKNGSNVRGGCEMEETHWMAYTIPPLPPHRSNL